jgi:colanic acid/amylovoran biosynthesis protein
MIIEVTGTSVRNKGAELMLVAAREALGQVLPGTQIAVSPFFGSYADKVHHGLLQKIELRRCSRTWTGVKLLPRGFRKSFGLVVESDIDAVLDASGFAFGDQHEVKRARDFSTDVRRWKKQGKVVVLLPQALGPFSRPEVREAFKPAAELADRIYARDTVSLQHLEELCGKDERFRQAPDFTNLLEPDYIPATPAELLLVPNHRMIEKMKPEDAALYVPFLAQVAEYGAQLNLETAVLLHDTVVDHMLVEPLEKQLGRSVRVIQETDPLRLKAWLGAAKVVVGSRFHALAGSLCQAVPTVASGWSHKYQMLFEDYGCPEMVLPVTADFSQVAQRLDEAVGGAGRESLVERLKAAGDVQRAAVESMWSDVGRVMTT